MSVEFSPVYPTTTASASKPTDVQTLQEVFAMALRNHGTANGGTAVNTMLEIISAPRSEDIAGNDRNQQRREHQQQTDRNDFANNDRKLLDKSENRSSEMNSAYRDRIDRTEMSRRDYHKRIERTELPQSTVQPSTVSSTPSVVLPLDVAKPNVSVIHSSHSPPQQNVPTTVGTNSPSPSVSALNSVANIGQMNVVASGGNTSASVPSPAAPPMAPRTFTLFTPSGRFGQTQRKTDEKEDDEEPIEGKEAPKHQPFAAFESIRLSRQDTSQQPRELPAKQEIRQVTAKPREKPKEVEPDQAQSIKTVEEFLNTLTQNVVASKKGEPNPSNQTQYLNRVAAAFEAISHSAPIRIKLNLDHLGTLTLRLFHRANKLTLQFETPSHESAQFLHDHLDGLQTILSKRNMKIADIEIMLDS